MLSLTACGGGGDEAIEDAASRPNSFPGAKNPGDGFSESSTGDTSNANGLAKNEVRITVEVPSLLAPGAPLSRRNLHLVQPDSISVYQTNQTLRKINTVDTAERQDDDGFTVIQFPGGQPVGPDVVIEVRYAGATLRAFATDRDRDIKVNPFSEYAVRYGLGGYSATEFSAVMDCVNSTDSSGLCINKFVWSTLADQVQDFEINIPDGTSMDAAVARLSNRTDFSGYVEDMSDLAQVAPTNTGTISADSVNMNSVYFGLELGQSTRFSSTPAAQWATQRAYAERIENDGVAYIYPGLSMTSFSVFGINVTSMASDIPYQRSTLNRFDNGLFDARSRSFWGINSHATSPSAASIKNQDRLLAGASLYQSITDKTGALPIGWTRNPFYLDAHVLLSADDYPDTLLANYFSGGKAIGLKKSDDDYQRQSELETYYVSSFDIGLAQSENFSTGTLLPDYNVMSFSIALGDSTIPFRAESLVGNWHLTSGETYRQTAAALAITRDASGHIGTGTPNRDDTANVSNLTSQLSSGDVYNGRLNLLFSNSTGGITDEDGVGASNPDAGLLAFNLDNPTNGEGILLAMRSGSSGPERARYQLSGTIAGLGDDTQYLQQIDGGGLSITSVSDNDVEATLDLNGFQITEDISSGALTPPTEMAKTFSMIDTTTSADDRLELTDASNNATLTGYLSSDREFIVLRYRQTTAAGEEYLGLILGARENKESD